MVLSGSESVCSCYLQTSSKFSELHLFIGEAAPLGTPLDTVPFTVRLALQGRYSPSPARQAQKVRFLFSTKVSPDKIMMLLCVNV